MQPKKKILNSLIISNLKNLFDDLIRNLPAHSAKVAQARLNEVETTEDLADQ